MLNFVVLLYYLSYTYSKHLMFFNLRQTNKLKIAVLILNGYLGVLYLHLSIRLVVFFCIIGYYSQWRIILIVIWNDDKFGL